MRKQNGRREEEIARGRAALSPMDAVPSLRSQVTCTGPIPASWLLRRATSEVLLLPWLKVPDCLVSGTHASVLRATSSACKVCMPDRDAVWLAGSGCCTPWLNIPLCRVLLCSVGQRCWRPSITVELTQAFRHLCVCLNKGRKSTRSPC